MSEAGKINEQFDAVEFVEFHYGNGFENIDPSKACWRGEMRIGHNRRRRNLQEIPDPVISYKSVRRDKGDLL